jgi:negative regulator of sigma E activity
MDEFFARNRLSAYLDGELAPSEARDVEAALQRSPALRAELEELRRAVDLMHAHGPVAAPPGFAERVAARLATEPMRVGWWHRARRVRLEVVMVAAAAVVVLYVAGRKPEHGEPGEATQADAGATGEAAKPDAAAAGNGPVASAGADDAADEGEGAQADGVLGDEKVTAREAAALAQKLGRREPTPATGATPPPSKPSGATGTAQASHPAGSRTVRPSKVPGGVERDAYQPAWEQDGSEPPTVYSAGAVRYRLTPVNDTGLKELATLAASLGGRLTDGNGKPLAPYPMDSGDVRVVRVQVPAVNAATLESKLSTIGAVEIDPTVPDGMTLYAPGADIPVSIEVRQP